LYVNEAIRAEVFKILEPLVAKDVNAKNGRPGMLLWNILVMGGLRLNLNWDYDRLLEMVNHHRTIGEMLGHHFYDDNVKPYKLQTLKDNVSFLTTDVIDQINQVVVKSGHKVLKKPEVQQVAVIETYKIDLLCTEELIVKAKLMLPVLSASNELVILKQTKLKILSLMQNGK
jgi:hypothetical protein